MVVLYLAHPLASVLSAVLCISTFGLYHLTTTVRESRDAEAHRTARHMGNLLLCIALVAIFVGAYALAAWLRSRADHPTEDATGARGDLAPPPSTASASADLLSDGVAVPGSGSVAAIAGSSQPPPRDEVDHEGATLRELQSLELVQGTDGDGTGAIWCREAYSAGFQRRGSCYHSRGECDAASGGGWDNAAADQDVGCVPLGHAGETASIDMVCGRVEAVPSEAPDSSCPRTMVACTISNASGGWVVIDSELVAGPPVNVAVPMLRGWDELAIHHDTMVVNSNSTMLRPSLSSVVLPALSSFDFAWTDAGRYPVGLAREDADLVLQVSGSTALSANPSVDLGQIRFNAITSPSREGGAVTARLVLLQALGPDASSEALIANWGEVFVGGVHVEDLPCGLKESAVRMTFSGKDVRQRLLGIELGTMAGRGVGDAEVKVAPAPSRTSD